MPSIETIKDNLIPIFRRYNTKRAVLFGSYAKGTATERSDIDIYVESGLTGLKFFGLLEEITEALQKSVDLIDKSQIEKGSKIMSEIKKTGILIYGE